MTITRIIGAVAAGLVLATLPFLPYAHRGGHGEAHADHEPRHGGQLGMVGDHHVEVVRHRGALQVFVSDAWRRPVQPARGWATFDGSAATPLVWRNHRLVGTDEWNARIIGVEVVMPDGTRMATTFDVQVNG
jgi:hypothetical protein